MMLHTDTGYLSPVIRQDLRRITALVLDGFAELIAGKTATRYRSGYIVKLILHGDHAASDRTTAKPGATIRLMAIVNHPKLASRESDWMPLRDRLRRAWLSGEVAQSVSLAIHSLQEVNSALVDGVPHFVTVATDGIALYEANGARLAAPRRLPMPERRARGLVEFDRWHRRACDFLAGAGFYRDRGNTAMAALLVHQTCEHLYQCVAWSLALYGRRSHALDELRDVAEALEPRLAAAWPRATRFERHAFGCIRRAYVEARYARAFTIAPGVLAWAMERVLVLDGIVTVICRERLGRDTSSPQDGDDDGSGRESADARSGPSAQPNRA